MIINYATNILFVQHQHKAINSTFSIENAKIILKKCLQKKLSLGEPQN